VRAYPVAADSSLARACTCVSLSAFVRWWRRVHIRSICIIHIAVMHKESTQQDHTRELPCVRTHAHTHTYTRITCKIFRHRLTFLIHSSSVPPSLPPSISLSLSFPLALAPSRSRARALSLSQCTAESLRLYHWMVPRMRPKHRANQALMSRRMARWTRLLTPGRLIEVLSVSVCLCLSGCLSLSLSLSPSLCVCVCV